MTISMTVQPPEDRMIDVSITLSIPESTLRLWARQNVLSGRLSTAIRAHVNEDDAIYDALGALPPLS